MTGKESLAENYKGWNDGQKASPSINELKSSP